MNMNTFNPHNYEDDDHSYEGWEAVPGLFLKLATTNPYWGDMIK